MGLRDTLRVSTVAEHQALEGVLGLEAPDLTLHAYGRYLQGMRAMTASVERCLAQGLGGLGVDLGGRSKLGWLDRDLVHLGLAPWSRIRGLPPMESQAERLGCAYVFEGATLGGAVLYERLARRWALGPQAGAAYLYGYGPDTGPMWRRFCEMLDAAPLDDAGRDECAAAANATFRALREAFSEPAAA